MEANIESGDIIQPEGRYLGVYGLRGQPKRLIMATYRKGHVVTWRYLRWYERLWVWIYRRVSGLRTNHWGEFTK